MWWLLFARHFELEVPHRVCGGENGSPAREVQFDGIRVVLGGQRFSSRTGMPRLRLADHRANAQHHVVRQFELRVSLVNRTVLRLTRLDRGRRRGTEGTLEGAGRDDPPPPPFAGTDGGGDAIATFTRGVEADIGGEGESEGGGEGRGSRWKAWFLTSEGPPYSFSHPRPGQRKTEEVRQGGSEHSSRWREAAGASLKPSAQKRKPLADDPLCSRQRRPHEGEGWAAFVMTSSNAWSVNVQVSLTLGVMVEALRRVRLTSKPGAAILHSFVDNNQEHQCPHLCLFCYSRTSG